MSQMRGFGSMTSSCGPDGDEEPSSMMTALSVGIEPSVITVPVLSLAVLKDSGLALRFVAGLMEMQRISAFFATVCARSLTFQVRFLGIAELGGLVGPIFRTPVDCLYVMGV